VVKRPFYVSISGKGGAGKTTLTVLLLKTLLENSKDEEILVVDADPATNLPQALGLSINKTIGDVAEEFRKGFHELNSFGFEKRALLEYVIMRDCIVEANEFDFIAMGRGEGEGCYCYVNSILSSILSKLVQNYDVVLIDMEAGLEHLNRRLDRHVNTMIVVVEPSVMGFKTAERIKEIIKEVKIDVEEIYVVGNRFPKNVEEKLYSWANSIGYKVAGILPEDPIIQEYNMLGKPLIYLPSKSLAAKAAKDIAKIIGLIDI
jgi:CO dehydrogenase maturation factor